MSRTSNKYRQPGFTIVELLIVIVVIGILAAITIVAYSGIQNKATSASLTSSLASAATQLKLDLVTNSIYPATLPEANGGKGISASPGTTYQYIVSNAVPQIFCIAATKSNQTYNISQEGVLLAGPCPLLYLDAGNSVSYPKTGTTWFDLSGNGKNGTLYNGVGYNPNAGGVLTFDGVSSNVRTPFAVPAGRALTIDVIGQVGSTAVNNNFISQNGPVFIRVVGGKARWNALIQKDSDGLTNWSFNTGNIAILPNVTYDFSMTYDGTSLKGYINGVEDINISVAGQIVPGTLLLTIGYTTGGEDSPLLGSVSTVKVYNKALSSSDITQNFNTVRGRYGL